MRIALAVLLALHGIAHLVGFLVPWRLVEPEDMVYETTLLAGRLDVGEAGIKALGVVWLLAAMAFLVAAFGAWTARGWWVPLTAGLAALSLLLSVLHWPDARVGVLVNAAILLALVVGIRLGWI